MPKQRYPSCFEVDDDSLVAKNKRCWTRSLCAWLFQQSSLTRFVHTVALVGAARLLSFRQASRRPRKRPPPLYSERRPR